MFKRRKPDEAIAPREPGAPAPLPHILAPQPFTPQPFTPSFAPDPYAAPQGGEPDQAPFAAAGVSEAMLDGGIRPAEDSGLGVPPRPAPPSPHKEASMARPPLPTPNAPSPGPSQGGMSQSGMSQSGMNQGGMSQSMGQGGMGQSMGPGGMSQGGMSQGGMNQGRGPSPMGGVAGPGGDGLSRPRPQAPERRTLVVGRGIAVQGTVQDAERLVVEGTVEASLIKASELAIALGGLFKGEVEVQDAEVAGTIDGTLTASGNLVVRSTGKVLGIARCRRLQVEDGGAITGRIEMLTDEGRSALQDTAA